jgi:2-dehydro-3-deoxygluconokinase
LSVLTVGEALGLFDPAESGPLRLGMPLTLRFAGAESNVAIALARLRVPVSWISRVGEDPIGALIVAAMAREGVDTSYVVTQPGRTGVFMKWREDGRTRVLYHRRGSAACDLRPADIPDAALEGVRVVHVTGITMAISDSAAELVVDLVARAKRRGIIVVFDPNFRPALPDTAAAAAARALPVLEHADWYLCGLEEGNVLWGTSTAAELAEAIPVPSVIRLGADGALVGGERVAPTAELRVIDEVGAGDAFAAGFEFGLLRGFAPPTCVRAANLLAGRALLGTGDWETLPRLDEVEAEIAALG